MEHIADQHGCVSVAWVGDGVLYARFENKISAAVGERYAARLALLIRQAESVKYFCDSRKLVNYDILARSAIVRAVLANRRRFASILVLTWAGGAGPVSRTFASAIGDSIEYVTEPDEFEARMLRVAPDARREIEPPSSALSTKRRGTRPA
jgi:hypothetical protein